MEAKLLKNGDFIDINNTETEISDLRMGLSWGDADKLDEAGKTEKSTFFQSIKNYFIHGHDDKKQHIKNHIDLDLSLFLFGLGKKLIEDKIIHFGKTVSKCNSIVHLGDNVSHNLKNDDNEIIKLNLKTLPNNVEKLQFVINIFNAKQKKQTIDMAKDITLRLMDSKNETEIARTVFNGYEGNAMIIAAELIRMENSWRLKIVGTGTTDDSIEELAEKYK